MGTYLSRSKTSTTVQPVRTTKMIVINQATCYQCNTSLRDRGVCVCGNVEIYGGTEELGRRVKKMEYYGDCSLVEYRAQ